MVRQRAKTLLLPTLVLALAAAAGANLGCATSVTSPARQAEVDHHLAAASRSYYAQDVPTAIRELEHVVAMTPNDADVRRMLGVLYLGRGRHEDARRQLEAACDIRDGFKGAQADLGVVYLAMTRWRAAAEIFRPLSRDDDYDDRQRAHVYLGWALYNEGRVREATREYETAIMLEPGLCQGYNNLGLAYERLGERMRAEEAWEQAIVHCPRYAEPLFHLGRLRAAQGDESGAMAAFQRCYSLEPSSQIGQRCAARRLL